MSTTESVSDTVVNRIHTALAWLCARWSHCERDEFGYERMIMPTMAVIAAVCLVVTVYRLLF